MFSFYTCLIINIINILLTFRENNKIKDNESKDLSYGNQNVFYEKYYDIINEHYIFSENAKYKIKGYLIKNIGTLLLFIFAFFILFSFISFIIIIMNDDVTYEGYLNNVILKPLFIFILLVLFIFIFISFNTNYNKLVIFGVYNSFYKCKLNELNNLIIPYIKLHEIKAINNEDDFTEQYIVTNILSSIINNNLVMTSCGDSNDFSNTKVEHLSSLININKKFKKYDKSSSFSTFNTTYKKDFAEYYKEVLSSNIDKQLVKTNSIYNYIYNMNGNKATNYFEEYNSSSDNIDKKWEINCTQIDQNCTVTSIQNVYLADNYIDMYKYKYRYRIFTIIYICKKIFTKENSENKFENYEDLLTFFSFYQDKGKNTPHKFLINIESNVQYNQFIDYYIKKYEFDNNIKNLINKEGGLEGIIKKNEEIGRIIKEKVDETVDIFRKELKNIIPEYETNKEYLNYIVSLHSKELFSLTHTDRKDKNNKNIFDINDSLNKNIIDNNTENERNIYSIIDDFLTISSHIRYNSYILNDKIINLHLILNDKNEELFKLIIDTNLNDNSDTELNNSFIYHIGNTYYRRTSEENRIIKPIFSHISSFVSVNDFNNNYLKQTIYTIYKQINDTYVKFNNKNENVPININEHILNGEDIQKEDSQSEIILNNANDVISKEFIIFYIINIMIIFIIFFIGKSNIGSYNIFSIIYDKIFTKKSI